jgi:hypothetical protein
MEDLLLECSTHIKQVRDLIALGNLKDIKLTLVHLRGPIELLFGKVPGARENETLAVTFERTLARIIDHANRGEPVPATAELRNFQTAFYAVATAHMAIQDMDAATQEIENGGHH